MDDPTPEPRPLYTPEFAAKRRRSIFWSMIMCLLMGLALLANALFGRDHDGMVIGSIKSGIFKYPWWMVASAGAALLAFGLWGLWGQITRRE